MCIINKLIGSGGDESLSDDHHNVSNPDEKESELVNENIEKEENHTKENIEIEEKQTEEIIPEVVCSLKVKLINPLQTIFTTLLFPINCQ